MAKMSVWVKNAYLCKNTYVNELIHKHATEGLTRKQIHAKSTSRTVRRELSGGQSASFQKYSVRNIEKSLPLTVNNKGGNICTKNLSYDISAYTKMSFFHPLVAAVTYLTALALGKPLNMHNVIVTHGLK